MLCHISQWYLSDFSHHSLPKSSDFPHEVLKALRKNTVVRSSGNGHMEFHVRSVVVGPLLYSFLHIQCGPLNTDQTSRGGPFDGEFGSLPLQALAHLKKVQNCKLLQLEDRSLSGAKVSKGSTCMAQDDRTTAGLGLHHTQHNQAAESLTDAGSPHTKAAHKLIFTWETVTGAERSVADSVQKLIEDHLGERNSLSRFQLNHTLSLISYCDIIRQSDT
jgi:hypothetical protein